MGLAIASATTMFSKEMVSNIEYRLTEINNAILALSRQTQDIVNAQARAGQEYMAQHTDEEGQVDASAIEWVNSTAFNKTWEAKLAAIQTKEQVLNLQKNSLQTQLTANRATYESWKKGIDNGIKFFSYGK